MRSTVRSATARAGGPWIFLKGACGARRRGGSQPSGERDIVRGDSEGTSQEQNGIIPPRPSARTYKKHDKK